MSIQSYSYLVFLFLLWMLNLLVGRSVRRRQALYLAASLAFYAAWGGRTLALLAASVLFNYAWALWLAKTPRRSLAILGIGANLGLLLLCKSSNMPGSLLPPQMLFLPVGMSFWTFQAMSYLIDVYRRKTPPITWGEFLLYMTFWPTVLAGPIHRVQQIVPQFRNLTPASQEDIAWGLRRLLNGIFLKVCVVSFINDGLRPSEGLLYGLSKVGPHTSLGGLDICFLALGYGLQLYFDFSGYSSIVIGSARLFGIRLVENFDHPYLAATPSDFWQRWHISLSAWIRDYVFLPLAIRQRGRLQRSLVLILTMLLFGLWHGLTPAFFAWGLYQGMLLAFYAQFPALHAAIRQSRRLALVSWAVTFASINLGWVLFFASNAESPWQTLELLQKVFSPASYLHLELSSNYYLVITLILAIYLGSQSIARQAKMLPTPLLPKRCATPIRWLAWGIAPFYDALLILLIILWNNTNTSFIYFQF